MAVEQRYVCDECEIGLSAKLVLVRHRKRLHVAWLRGVSDNRRMLDHYGAGSGTRPS